MHSYTFHMYSMGKGPSLDPKKLDASFLNATCDPSCCNSSCCNSVVIYLCCIPCSSC